MMKRQMSLTKLKPECIAEYKEYHQNVWPELELLYKRCGFLKISCFLNGCDLLVYVEVDEDVYQKMKSEIETSSIQRKWGEIMARFPDPACERLEFEEVYRLD